MPEDIAPANPFQGHRRGPDQLEAALHNIDGEARQLLANVPNGATTVERARRRDG
jgi:hypothetical protein